MDSQKLTMPWVEKYRPQSLNEISGIQNVKDKLNKFIQTFEANTRKIKTLRKNIKQETDEMKKKKLILRYKSVKNQSNEQKAKLLMGPPGVGKTTIVYALANDFNLKVIELNASDVRTADALEQRLKETVKTKNLDSFYSKPQGKLILIDEVDGLHGQHDRGGLKSLIEIIISSKFPIIMTCNFRDNQKFKSLYALVKPILTLDLAIDKDIATILGSIARKEKIRITPKQIKTIAQRSGGDFRSAINDLQALSQGTGEITDELLEKINMRRDTQANLEEGFQKMFEAQNIQDAKFAIDSIDSKDVDYRTIHKWMNENITKFFKNNTDLRNAIEHLAIVDNLLGHIGKTQDYSFLRYVFPILAGGMNLSKTDTMIYKGNLRFPRWFNYKKPPNDEPTVELQKLFRVSLQKIMQEIKPNLQLFVKNDKEMTPYLSSILQVSEKKVKSTLK